MTAEHAIEHLDELMAGLHRLVNGLSDECNAAVTRWEGLRRVGGQRADHAAALLGDVRGRLAQVRDYAERCRQQIEDIQADPFGRPEKGG